MSVTFLLFHTPNPRCIKRVNVSNEYNKTRIIYCKRSEESTLPFDVPENVEVTCIDVGNFNKNYFNKVYKLFKYMVRAYKELNQDKPNVLQVEGLHMLLLGYIFSFFYKNTKLVYEVADLHKVIYYSSKNPMYKIASKVLPFTEKFLVKKINKLILTSEFHWEDYYSKFLPETKYTFIPNVPFKQQFNDYKKQSKKRLTFGFIGGIRYRNELLNLIDIVKDDKELELLIAGAGNTDDYNFIKDYVKGYENIQFYGPYNYQKEIVSLYEKIDVVYSVYDASIDNVRVAIPNKYYEAIVCGLPLIVAKSTKLSSLVERYEVGFSVSHDDKIELSNLVNKLKSDKNSLYEIENNCLRIKKTCFYDNYIPKLVEVYNYQRNKESV
jgi:succinoglycan biosynthesis protein ExoL